MNRIGRRGMIERILQGKPRWLEPGRARLRGNGLSRYQLMSMPEKRQLAASRMQRIEVIRCAFCLAHVAERELAAHRTRCPGAPSFSGGRP